MFGSRLRVRFKTRTQAEVFLAETTQEIVRGEYIESIKIPKFSKIAEDWF